ncbi:MAG: TetR/AcrR family transcriptional regulator [Flavitalea sp.]
MAKIKGNKSSTRRDIIITKASALFREKGYSASSMRDLAEIVGVEAASLYNHISSKGEILQEICFKIANEFMSNIEKIDSSNISSIEKIEAILRFHVQHMLNHYEDVYVSDREWKHLPDPYLSNYQSQRRAYRQRMGRIIDDGIAKGEIKDIDSSTAVLIMLHAVSGIESWHRSKKKVPGELLEENMLMILIDGMRK